MDPLGELRAFGETLLDQRPRGAEVRDAMVRFIERVKRERHAGRVSNDDFMSLVAWWSAEVNRRGLGTTNLHHLTLELRPRR